MLRANWIIFTLLIALDPTALRAQSDAVRAPAKGIVWSPPESTADVRADMEAISSYGADAVRLPLVYDENIHVIADMFGLTLFQELDARYLPAVRFAERRGAYLAALDSAIELASKFQGQHRFGLGYWVDTSVPEACAVMRELGERVRRRLPGAKVYYVSAFIESDVCSDVVDFVLLDAKGTTSSVDLIRRWRRHSDTPVGISGLGFPVRENAGYGYRSRYSEQHQARMLEIGLGHLLPDKRLTAVFVNRWRDKSPNANPIVDEAGDYGIRAPSGLPRPSGEVVRGLYSGSQTAFAIDAGETSGDDFSWINLISFLSVALFGLTYYGSISLRSVVRRYFLSHSIYLEKLGDGREAAIGTSLFLLMCLSLAASIVGMTVVTDLSGTRLWYPILHWCPNWIAVTLQAGAARSGLLVPVFAALFGLVALMWASVLALSTRGTRRVRFGQTLMIAVMPRWPVALIGLLALVVLNWRMDAPGVVLVAVVAIWFVVVLVYTGRMLSDFLRLLGIRALWTVPVLILALAIVSGVVWLFIVTNDLRAELEYLWNIVAGA